MDDVLLLQLKASLIRLKNCSYSGNSKRCDSMLTHSTWCTLGFYYLKRKSWRRFHLWLPLVWSDSPIEVILLVTDFDHIQLIFRFSNTSTEQAHLLLSDPVVVRGDLVISDFFGINVLKKFNIVKILCEFFFSNIQENCVAVLIDRKSGSRYNAESTAWVSFL